MPRSTGYILPAPDVNPFTTYYGFFVQDDWRPTPTLTINVGVRYDLRPPMLDRTNQLGNFDRDFPGGRVIVSDEAGLALVPDFVRQSVPNTPFITAAEAGLPKSLRRTDKNNVNPRLGIAWRPFGDSRTVIRGGVRLYTVPLLGSVNYSMVATVTAAAVNFANTAAAPFVFPQISSAATAEGALPPGTLDFRRANQIDMKDPRTTQWTLTFERDLGWNTGARVSYVGSKTNDLVWSPDLNQVPANTAGYAAVSQTRPFLDWNVVTTRDNAPRSRYDGLGLELNKRFSNSVALNASYTLARHLSDAGGTVPTAFATENGATTVDLFRGDADYGNVAFTRRHRFVSTFLYELPFGRSRRAAERHRSRARRAGRRMGCHRRALAAVGPVPDAVIQQRRSVRNRHDGARIYRDTASGCHRRRKSLQPDSRRVLRCQRLRASRRQHRALRQREVGTLVGTGHENRSR